MKSSTFYKWLTILTILLLAVIVSLTYTKTFKQVLPISLVSLIFFNSLSIIVYYLGNAAAINPNKNRLTQLIMVLTFFKLASCPLIIVVYNGLFHPPDNHYVLPFILIYITFTVFEVIMLSKANKIAL